jgi:hypothetical protein
MCRFEIIEIGVRLCTGPTTLRNSAELIPVKDSDVLSGGTPCYHKHLLSPVVPERQHREHALHVASLRRDPQPGCRASLQI